MKYYELYDRNGNLLQQTPIVEVLPTVMNETTGRTLVDSDTTVYADTTGGSQTWALPDAAGRLNKEFTIVKVSSDNSLSLNGMINGNNSITITDKGAITVSSNNESWWLI